MRLFIVLILFWAQVGCAEDWSVYFSPNGGATDGVVRELATAKKTLRIQAYSFTSKPIAKAIVDAKKRGVDVKVILDKTNEKDHYSAATFLVNAGIPVWIDYLPPIAHNKVMIVDEETVITGSFNFTRQAESNAENLLILHDPALAAKYEANWEAREKVSRDYKMPLLSCTP